MASLCPGVVCPPLNQVLYIRVLRRTLKYLVLEELFLRVDCFLPRLHVPGDGPELIQ